MKSKAASKGAKNTFKNYSRLLHVMLLISWDQIMLYAESINNGGKFYNF